MAYDEGHLALLRDDLQDQTGIAEKKMFGGICFMLNGNMLCGVHKGGGMFRVGKELEAAALAIDGASEMAFTKRPMPGFIDADEDLFADDARRLKILRLALDYVGDMPAK
ncbi:TfoX/Sxy family protein [Cognatishimia sp. SS12]|uniref:TfoX/Sxy family protein n=1 Tax=Cognatishimia sp. SS12 TaxID=2979465 RepID=UPI00232E5C2F|nr:TfoX/Sxy family protein [Cognatishimia sp. SS12]MDC0737161.1 TfoX/Sxy family protein [Cognatishimia sp. SS12]